MIKYKNELDLQMCKKLYQDEFLQIFEYKKREKLAWYLNFKMVDLMMMLIDCESLIHSRCYSHSWSPPQS